jgi:hypothetical protein
MTGDWVTAVTRWVMRPQTYELTVAPAIADLQHEAATAGLAGRVQGYAGLWRAIIGAFANDIHVDFTLAFNDEARSTAWRAAGQVFGGLFLLSLFTDSRVLFDIDEMGIDGVMTVFIWRLPSHAAAWAPALVIPVAVVLTRRLEEAKRPVLLSAAILAALFVLGSATIVVPATHTAEQYVQAAFWRNRMETSHPPRSLEDVRQEMTVPIARPDQRLARAGRNRFLTHDVLSRGASTFGFALIGVGLARKRARRAVLWAVLACAVWAAVMSLAMEIYSRVFFPQPPLGLFPWTRTIALFLVGTIVLRNAGRRDRRVA